MFVVTCNWIPLLSSFSELQRLTISMQYRYTMEPLPARLHHHCLRNREWNKAARGHDCDPSSSSNKQMCPLSTSTFCVATIYHFALSTSDLAQYRIITIYSISTIVQYIQCTVNIQYTISSSGPMNEVEAEVSYEFIGKLF